jgi:ATP-dependent DNA helicase HFM1/MER3
VVYLYNIAAIGIFVAKKDYVGLMGAINLQSSLTSKVWDNSKYVSRQLEGVGPQMSQTFVNARICSFDDLLRLDARQIEVIAGRNPPFGIL